jgi:membrane-associated protein
VDSFAALTTYLHTFVDMFLHLDVHLAQLVQVVGPWLYVIAFAIIFCETGLVVMPFLPGDSFLFALGALAALDGSPLHIMLLSVLLFVAAVLGDGCNYAIGYKVGDRLLKSRFVNPLHLAKTQEFYQRHGGKTIILARFVPIIRTFAPFVAGLGKMSYRRFGAYNVVGGALWVIPFLFGGYFLGNAPLIKRNFHTVIVAIIVLSIAPAAFEFFKAHYMKKKTLNIVA